MTVYEILTIALLVFLALATTVAIYIGVLGLLGGFYLVRCEQCEHFMFSFALRPQHSCARCRHPVLMHPVHTVTHPTEVRSS
jgi:hypothetical protein